ncbi:MAG: hypothetical protein E6R03_10040 [Hyphomicrobiaceae bacterium]|nr:MAG: hypothetical protein E6R03_10040 [Hyphomicrobiaceae bacterium]
MTSEPYNHLTDPLRSKRITASICGAILGNNPWMTRDDAMRSLVRDALGAEREFKGSPPTEWGNANEAGALLEFQMETGLTVTPAKFTVPEDDEGIFGCSPDGWTSDGYGIETKCPFGLRKTPEAPAPFKSINEQLHYFDQCQFSMFVTGRKLWHFFQWCPVDTAHVVVEADQVWRDQSLPILRQFHAELIATINDPDLSAEHLAPLRVVIDTPDAARMLREYSELVEQIELATERKKDLLADIVEKCGGKNALFAGAKVTQTNRKGSVAYAAVVKKHCKDVDLEPFRGKPSSFWGITE